jgi:hypothetical protein
MSLPLFVQSYLTANTCQKMQDFLPRSPLNCAGLSILIIFSTTSQGKCVGGDDNT